MGRGKFEVTLAVYEAAAILACGDQTTDTKKEAAAAARVTPRTIEIWLQKQPAFSGLVDVIRREYAKKAIDRIEGDTLVDFEYRVKCIDRRYQALLRIQQARAAKADPLVPGSEEGLLKVGLVTIKDAEGNDDGTILVHGDIDTALISAMDDAEKSIHKQVMDLTTAAAKEDDRQGVEWIVD